MKMASQPPSGRLVARSAPLTTTTFCKWARETAERMSARRSSTMSVEYTRPVGPTCGAMRIVMSPRPAPTSATVMPGFSSRIPTSLTVWLASSALAPFTKLANARQAAAAGRNRRPWNAKLIWERVHRFGALDGLLRLLSESPGRPAMDARFREFLSAELRQIREQGLFKEEWPILGPPGPDIRVEG